MTFQHALRRSAVRGALAAAALAASGCAVPRLVPPPGPVQVTAIQAARLQDRILRWRQLAIASAARFDLPDVTLTDGIGTVLASEPVVHVAFPEQVFFDFDSDALRPAAAPVCDLIAAAVRQDVPGAQATVVGHTDAIGTDAYNIDLSQRRALAVIAALAARGVDPASLSAVAVGRRQPIAADDTEAGRAANRRVEFLVSPSIAANLALIGRAPPDPSRPPPEGSAVAVLRPAAAPGPLTLAAIGSIALNEPAGASTAMPGEPVEAEPLPQATADQPQPPQAVQAAAPEPAPSAVPRRAAPAALPRVPAPQFSPRSPDQPVTY